MEITTEPLYRYECWCPLCPDLSHEWIDANSGFMARAMFAAGHTGMEIGDVAARRDQEDDNDGY